MNYIIRIDSYDGQPQYVEHMNGWHSTPTLTANINRAKNYSEEIAREYLDRVKGFVAKEKDGEMLTVELVEVSAPKSDDDCLIEDVPSSLVWKDQGTLFGVSFHVARSGNNSYYRCVANGKTRTQKRNGKAVSAEFCRLLLKIMEERIDAHEKRIANL